MKIFVLHYSKLVDRKRFIMDQFEKQNITDYEFIEQHNKEELVNKHLFKELSDSKISLIMKHFHVYRQAIHHDISLIFEDDVILADNFNETLQKYMSQLPKDFDMLFIGDGCNLHIPSVPNKNIYEKGLYPTKWGGNGASRCSDSYIISNKCALKLCSYISKMTSMKLPIDWWINEAARDMKLKVYWAEPTIVTQGSLNGFFESSLN